jgi:hypothetical protein
MSCSFSGSSRRELHAGRVSLAGSCRTRIARLMHDERAHVFVDPKAGQVLFRDAAGT